jgi:ABC-type sugar transport system substrate-binding protein
MIDSIRREAPIKGEKKMKKLICLVLALAFSLSLTAGNIAAASQTVDIGLCATDTTNPFIGWLTGAVKEQGEAEGLKVQIADAGGSAIKQLEQMENFIAMGVKSIGVWPVDPNNMQDVIRKAQENGVKVLVGGTDTGVFDVMMNMDQYNAGEQIAEMGIEWLLKTFSTDGTPEKLSAKPKVIIIKQTSTIDSTNRSNGIIDKITKWGFADVVVAQGEAITSTEARTVIENMWQQNADAQLIMTYNADSALGVNEFLMGQPGLDYSKLAIFSGDNSEPIMEIINMSTKNESVFRGTMSIVGPAINGVQMDLPVATYQALRDLANGTYSWGSRITDTIAKTYPAE